MSKLSGLSVLKSSFKMASATVVSRVLGLVREQVMAFYFGASGLTDAFLVAYRIPNLLRDLFAEGAFSSALVPGLSEVRDNQKDFKELVWSIFILLVLITGFLSILIFIFAPQIVQVMAPSFVDDNQKYLLTIWLTRLMSPFLLFVSIAALFMGALNTMRVFFLPAMAPACFNITMIITMVVSPFFLNSMGIHPIYSLGLGVFLGGLVQLFVQLPKLFSLGIFPVLPKKILNKKSKKVFIKLGPGLVGFAATQVNLIVNTILASGTVVGAVSWLSYAFRLFQFPVGILGVSVANSTLVHFSECWNDGDKDKAFLTLKSSIFLSSILLFPAGALLYSMATPSIHLIFERGLFSFNDSAMTTKALEFYLLGLPFYGLYKILVPVFYAIDQQKVPVYCSIFSIVFNIIFCIVLTPHYGFAILALGTTISMFLNSTAQYLILTKKQDLNLFQLLDLRILKVILSSALCYFLVHYGVKKYFIYEKAILYKIIIFIIIGLIGVLTYSLGLILMGEGKSLKGIIKKITRRNK